MDITKQAEDALHVSLNSLKNTMKVAKDKLQSLCLKLLNSKEQISTLIDEQRPVMPTIQKPIRIEKQPQQIYLQARRGPGRRPRRAQVIMTPKTRQNSEEAFILEPQQIPSRKRPNKKESGGARGKSRPSVDPQPSQDADYLTAPYLQMNTELIPIKRNIIIIGKGWRCKQDTSYSSIHKLVLNEVESMDAVCNLLPKLTSLQELVVYDTVTCQEKNILLLVGCIPPSITRLYFSCSNQFSMECVSVLKKRQIVNFQILEYFFDLQRDLRKVDETLYFKEKDRGVRIEPLEVTETLQLVSIFPNIRNLWLPIKNYWKQPRIVPFEQLNALCLGQLEEEFNQSETKPDKRLIKSLYKAHSLRYLSLLNVFIEDIDFIKLVSQNHELTSLYLECCPTVTEQGLRHATRGSKMINFSIKDCAMVSGAFLEDLPNTQIFVMDQAVKPIDKPTALGSFKGLNRLNYLNLYGNSTFSDSHMYELTNCSNSLRSLNIGYTSISSKSVEAFKQFVNLECICLDENKLQISDILQILTNTPRIEKLSICGYNGNGEKGELLIEHLNLIGSCLPQLTHLSIKYCRSLDGNIDPERFSRLRFVEIDQQTNSQLVEVLRSKGVSMFVQD